MLSSLGVLAPLVLFYQQVKDFALKFLHIFWKKRELTYDFWVPFYKMMTSRSFIITFDDYHIFKSDLYSDKYGIMLPVLLKLTGLELALYKGFIPVLFIANKTTGAACVSYIKFTFPFERLLREVSKQYYDELSRMVKSSVPNRFHIDYRRGKSLKFLTSQHENTLTPTPSSSQSRSSNEVVQQNAKLLDVYTVMALGMNDRILCDSPQSFKYFSPGKEEKNKYQLTHLGAKILHQCEAWLKSATWYQERNIDWRRAFLLYGAPGNGKSSTVLEIARLLRIPIFIYDLSTFDNNEFQESLDQLSRDPAIILFEDLETVFEGRNKLSGVNSIKNKLIFATTNHIEKLDEAVFRDGRMDEKFEVMPLNVEEKTAMAQNILEEWPELIVKVLSESEYDSTAQFENRCVRTALSRFWQDKKG